MPAFPDMVIVYRDEGQWTVACIDGFLPSVERSNEHLKAGDAAMYRQLPKATGIHGAYSSAMSNVMRSKFQAGPSLSDYQEGGMLFIVTPRLTRGPPKLGDIFHHDRLPSERSTDEYRWVFSALNTQDYKVARDIFYRTAHKVGFVESDESSYKDVTTLSSTMRDSCIEMIARYTDQSHYVRQYLKRDGWDVAMGDSIIM